MVGLYKNPSGELIYLSKYHHENIAESRRSKSSTLKLCFSQGCFALLVVVYSCVFAYLALLSEQPLACTAGSGYVVCVATWCTQGRPSCPTAASNYVKVLTFTQLGAAVNRAGQEGCLWRYEFVVQQMDSRLHAHSKGVPCQ